MEIGIETYYYLEFIEYHINKFNNKQLENGLNEYIMLIHKKSLYESSYTTEVQFVNITTQENLKEFHLIISDYLYNLENLQEAFIDCYKYLFYEIFGTNYDWYNFEN